jgi:hypothetical protein
MKKPVQRKVERRIAGVSKPLTHSSAHFGLAHGEPAPQGNVFWLAENSGEARVNFSRISIVAKVMAILW